MPTVVERIQYVVEASTGAAQRGLKDLKTEMSSADSLGGKIKGGLANVGSAIKDNLAIGLAGAGAAVGGFVAKAIGDFQSLALEADKMAAATGLSVQDASRWAEVAGDMGVSVDAVATAANRLNREAAEGKLAEFGIQAQDANGRLLETVTMLAGIKDEAERARVANQLLGKGWTELAPLIEASSTLKQNLADVSDAKVIDPEEVEKAKRYRDAMDNLNGILEDLSLTVGEAVVPVLSDMAGLLKTINDTGLPGWLTKGGNLFEFTGRLWKIASEGQSPSEAWRTLTGDDKAKAPTPTMGPTLPASTTIVNNYPPGTTPRSTAENLEDWYRRNGGRP